MSPGSLAFSDDLIEIVPRVLREMCKRACRFQDGINSSFGRCDNPNFHLDPLAIRKAGIRPEFDGIAVNNAFDRFSHVSPPQRRMDLATLRIIVFGCSE